VLLVEFGKRADATRVQELIFVEQLRKDPAEPLRVATGTGLLKAIDHVLYRESYLNPQLKADDWAAIRSRPRQFTKELTQRQRAIVSYMPKDGL